MQKPGPVLSMLSAAVACTLPWLPPGALASGGVDEVTVPGTRSPDDLRRALIEAEDEIYAVFNRLTEDHDYDIICTVEGRVGSQFRRRVCKAGLYRDAAARSAEEFSEEEGNYPSRVDDGYHGRVLRQKMRDLAAAHP